MHVSVCKSGIQLRAHSFSFVHICSGEIGLRCCFFSLLQRVKRPIRHRSPVPQSPVQRSLSTSPVRSWAEISVSTSERGYTLVQLDQQFSVRMEEMIHQPQESMKIMQQDAARQAEVAKQQAEVMAQQAELIARLQQQTGASASHQAPPPPRVPILRETANVQEDTDIPTGPAPSPILRQLSKAPTPTNLPDSLFEFEKDPTALKVSKLEKLFKKSQGAHSIPDIEDGYTDSAVTLPDRFKMPHIDRFDGSGDPMKLSLFGWTLSGVAAIWYAKLEDSVKRNWEEIAEAFIAQYFYNTQIEITTRDLETTRQEPNESFFDFVTR
ncbi:hypothetical protein ACSBR1_009522 [Camellia fascicularis]